MRLRRGDTVTERGDAPGSESANGANGVEAPAQPTHAGPLLGDLLVGHDLISKEELANALLEQSTTGRKLGEVLMDLGLLDEAQLLRLLSEQLGLEVVDLRRVTLDPSAVELVPESLVRSGPALPVHSSDEVLHVAVATAPSEQLKQQFAAASGRRIEFVLSRESDIRTLIDKSYRALSGLDQLVDAFTGLEAVRLEGITDLGGTGGTEDSSPVAQVVNRVITQAVRERASDIHIEPQESTLRIRYRVDGALHDAVELPPNLAQALVSRIKILADMNIVERRRSQDGQLEITVDGRELDIRVATMATIWGEKVVMRVLDRSRSLFELAALGMSPRTRADFSRMIRSPFGMVICAGPTGSGKTTTLYAALNQIADAERNVTTIEDPVEYVFPGINQIQINEAADITFAGGLKAILRQDPDVILVGEMRDVETARIAVQSALTGHLVLSSLHATDATAALHRFLDMGIEAFLVSSAVVGVMAQRLVRRICESCREPYEPSAEELAFYHEWGGKPKSDFTHGAGCNFCAHTGYVDRVGVYELLSVTPEIKQLIVDHASRDLIFESAVSGGMTTLREEALRAIQEDVTTISDVLRSVYIS
jgi:type IV pilus assembly protein PilB